MSEIATFLLTAAADIDDARERMYVDDAIDLEGVAISVGYIDGQPAVSVETGGRTFLALIGDSDEFVARDTNGRLIDLAAEAGE